MFKPHLSYIHFRKSVENRSQSLNDMLKKQQNKTITLMLIHQKVLHHLTSLLTIAT